MKLKNKLLPFIGIAAIGATFAPLALTSCKNNTTKGAIDLREWYTPTIEKHAYAILDADEVDNLYFCGDEEAEWGDWIDEDEMNERLTQDYLFGSSMWAQYANEHGLTNEDAHLWSQLAEKMPAEMAEPIYYSLLGIENVQSADMEAAAESKPQSQFKKLTYEKYNISLSDVRIAHMTNYKNPLLPVEYPTISFNIEFDIDYNGVLNLEAQKQRGLGLGIKYTDQFGNVRQGMLDGSSMTTNHKGTITVVNVPIMIDYNNREEFFGAKAWSLKFDYQTIVDTETSTQIPFAIYGTDNVTNVVDAELSGKVQHQESTRVYDFDYYSNMNWEKLVAESTIKEAEAESETAYKAAYDAAIAEGYTETQAVIIAEAAKQQTYNEYVVEHGAYNLFTGLNASFFDTISYYLLSIERKM